ncbi:MAG: hypothetical protein SVX38_02295, partial [Chloroflexota bacterium]|nr:hypothetical protein [Chloroflexota bacterium]
MSKMKSLVSTLIAIVMLVSLSVVAQAQGTQSQLTGEITAITPTEGGVVITMLDEEGNSSDVFISEDTAIADLEVGWTVTVTVVQQEDGTFHATAVMVEDDDEDDGECEDCLHPVATQLAEYFGVDYQELVAYHD